MRLIVYLLAALAITCITIHVILTQSWHTEPLVVAPHNTLTIVTAYYMLPMSKHSVEKYQQWLPNLLSLKACMMVYHDGSVNVSSRPFTRWSVQPLEDIMAASPFAQSLSPPKHPFWKYQRAIDPERSYHRDYRLYWMWTLKTTFLTNTIRDNPFNTPYFFWMDAGSQRDTQHTGQWLWSPQVPPGKIVFAEAALRLPDTISPYDNHISGAMFGGDATAVLRFHDAFVALWRNMSEQDLFVGKDQILYNMLCYSQDRDLCHLVQAPRRWRVPWSEEIRWSENPWFYVLTYLLESQDESVYLGHKGV